MVYTLSQERSVFKGNALRNALKLSRSGIADKIIRYFQHPSEKSLKLSIHNGNPEDARVLIESVISQQQREEIQERGKVPNGFTRSPKLGAQNYAFTKCGCNSTDAATYVSRQGKNVIIEQEGAALFCNFFDENREYLGNDVF